MEVKETDLNTTPHEWWCLPTCLRQKLCKWKYIKKLLRRLLGNYRSVKWVLPYITMHILVSINRVLNTTNKQTQNYVTSCWLWCQISESGFEFLSEHFKCFLSCSDPCGLHWPHLQRLYAYYPPCFAPCKFDTYRNVLCDKKTQWERFFCMPISCIALRESSDVWSSSQIGK